MTATLLLGGMNAQWQRDRMEDRLEQGQELQDWLGKRPNAWAQSIAMRAALRSLPFLNFAPDPWLKRYTFYALRPLLITWSAQNFPKLDWPNLAADIVNADQLEEAALESEKFESPVDYVVLAAVNAAQSLEVRFGPPSTEVNTVDTVSMADGAIEAAQKLGFQLQMAPSNVWEQMLIDKRWLEDNISKRYATRIFSRRSLWLGYVPKELGNIWCQLSARLLTIDRNYSVWIDWYERRIRGERAAFDIPGDRNRTEDKAILRRLAEATDEDFWGKGHEYVNATLKGWLDEARARVAAALQDQQPETENLSEIEVPPPVSRATAYGLNGEGKLDPLPHYDQQHLRDLQDQRRAYADMREAALELHQEGQRLGPKLLPKLDRFIDAVPERFEEAKAWPIWSAATALRTLYWKHKAVAENPEPDVAKLDPAVAVDLRGFLDIYNVFAFGDDGLRQKDENSISPQERLKAEEQAQLSQPIQKAIVDTVAIRTEATLEEITENQDNVVLTDGTPYADQAVDQANKTTQSLVVGLTKGAQSVLANSEAVGAELAKLGIKGAATSAIGAVGCATYNYAALIEFIAFNAEPLKAYVATIYQSYTHLPDMIDRLKALWAKLRN